MRLRLKTVTHTLIEKLNPAKLGYSPKMASILTAITGHDYGSRDGRGNLYTGLSITSDGFVIAQTEPISSGAFLGTASDLTRNLNRLIEDANLTPEERAEYERLYTAHVTDWR